EVDQTLIDNLRSRFSRYVASKVDIQLAGYLQIIGGPGISHGIKQTYATSACDCDQRISVRSIPVHLCGLKMHPRQGSDDFQVSELFRADVHEQIFALRVVAIQTLN